MERPFGVVSLAGHLVGPCFMVGHCAVGRFMVAYPRLVATHLVAAGLVMSCLMSHLVATRLVMSLFRHLLLALVTLPGQGAINLCKR
jgi:hypothetical protein